MGRRSKNKSGGRGRGGGRGAGGGRDRWAWSTGYDHQRHEGRSLFPEHVGCRVTGWKAAKRRSQLDMNAVVIPTPGPSRNFGDFDPVRPHGKRTVEYAERQEWLSELQKIQKVVYLTGEDKKDQDQGRHRRPEGQQAGTAPALATGQLKEMSRSRWDADDGCTSTSSFNPSYSKESESDGNGGTSLKKPRYGSAPSTASNFGSSRMDHSPDFYQEQRKKDAGSDGFFQLKENGGIAQANYLGATIAMTERPQLGQSGSGDESWRFGNSSIPPSSSSPFQPRRRVQEYYRNSDHLRLSPSAPDVPPRNDFSQDEEECEVTYDSGGPPRKKMNPTSIQAQFQPHSSSSSNATNQLPARIARDSMKSNETDKDYRIAIPRDPSIVPGRREPPKKEKWLGNYY